jgi:hypothetical protein
MNHINDYVKFVHVDFEEYMRQMQIKGTYGDHLTLLAIIREYNSQYVVISTSGLDHTAIVSNDSLFHKDVRTIVLGNFPEHSGMHVNASDLQTCVKK